MANVVLLRSTVMFFVLLFGVVVVQMQMTSAVPLAADARVLAEANLDAAGVKVGAKARGNGVDVRAKVGAKAGDNEVDVRAKVGAKDGGNGAGVGAKVSAKAGGNEDKPIVGGGGVLDYDYGYGGGN